MTENEIIELVTEITGNGIVTSNQDNFIAIHLEGHKGSFIVNKRKCKSNGNNYGKLFDRKRLREEIKKPICSLQGHYVIGVDMTDEERRRIAETPITMDCFEMDDYSEGIYDNVYHSMDMEFTHGGSFYCDNLDCVWEDFIEILEQLRQKYNETKDKKYWKELIRLLPNSYKVVKL